MRSDGEPGTMKCHQMGSRTAASASGVPCWLSACFLCIFFIHSLHAFQSADQVQCSRHSVAALQPALSWNFPHHVNKNPSNCRYSLT